ncbi:reverse transcriptase domain-containing protein [Tanacetum coccineum]
MSSHKSEFPTDLHEAIEMAQGLMYQVVQELGENFGDKRKWNGNHYNNNNPNITSNLNPNKRPEAARVFTAGQGSYAGKLPYCGKCGRHHTNACPPTCHNCGRAGHKVKDCRAPPRHLFRMWRKRTLQEQVSEQWKSMRWKPNSRQPTKSSEQLEAESRKS